jgi:hypothetical protein
MTSEVHDNPEAYIHWLYINTKRVRKKMMLIWFVELQIIIGLYCYLKLYATWLSDNIICILLSYNFMYVIIKMIDCLVYLDDG